MDLANIQVKVTDFIKKYKYVAIILVVGLIFMLIPTKAKKKTVMQMPTVKIEEERTVDNALEDILSQIYGAGEVRVLLTVSSGEETIYQTDNKLNQSKETTNTQTDTVMVTDSNRNETGLIKQTIPPVYRGAIVVCQGADSAIVRLSIVEAVSRVTGLSSDRISILKMK